MSELGRARAAFGLAHRLAPQRERAWLEDMRLEYGFVQGRGARLRWLLGMVGFALRLRAATFGGTPAARRLLLASLASALFVVVVVSPLKPPTPAGLDRAGDEAATVAPEPSPVEAATAEAARDVPAPDTVPSARAAPPTAPRPTLFQQGDALFTAQTDQDETEPAEAATTGTSVSDATVTDATVTDATVADTAVADTAAAESPPVATDLAQTAPAASADPVVTAVTSPAVTLQLTAPARLELRRGAADGPVLQQGTFPAGQTFSVQVPFYLHTSDAGAVTARAETDLGRLGRVGEPQTRLFVRP